MFSRLVLILCIVHFGKHFTCGALGCSAELVATAGTGKALTLRRPGRSPATLPIRPTRAVHKIVFLIIAVGMHTFAVEYGQDLHKQDGVFDISHNIYYSQGFQTPKWNWARFRSL
jgi:hypothetical protein